MTKHILSVNPTAVEAMDNERLFIEWWVGFKAKSCSRGGIKTLPNGFLSPNVIHCSPNFAYLGRSPVRDVTDMQPYYNYMAFEHVLPRTRRAFFDRFHVLAAGTGKTCNVVMMSA